MNWRDWRNLYLIYGVIFVLCFVVTAHCQEVKPIEQLANQTWRVTIDGAEFHCLTPDKSRQILQDRAELESLRQQIVILKEQLAVFAQIKEIVETERAKADEQINLLRQQTALLEKRISDTDALLQKAIDAAKRSKLETWLSSPVLALGLKVVIPLGNLIATGLK